MALPSLTKTWRTAHETILAGANVSESRHRIQWALFNMLRGQKADNSGALTWLDSAGASASAPSQLWTPESTNAGDGVNFGNNDQVNHITTLADVVIGLNAANHTYWVLKNSAVGTQLCCDLRYSTFGNEGQWDEGLLMSIDGFGAANGGTDGTATARPTATDEHKIHVSGTGAFSTTGNQTWDGALPGANVHQIHVWASTDGEAWAVAIFRNGHSIFFGFIHHMQSPTVIPGAPNHTVNGDDVPYVACFVSAVADGTANRASRSAHFTGGNKRLITHAGNFIDNTQSVSKEVSMGAEVALQGGFILARQGRSEMTDNHPITPITALTDLAGFKGRFGVLTDIWLGSDTDLGVAEGDSYPDDLTRQFVAVGFFVLPGDSTVFAVS